MLCCTRPRLNHYVVVGLADICCLLFVIDVAQLASTFKAAKLLCDKHYIRCLVQAHLKNLDLAVAQHIECNSAA